jgi:hypothetical protein
MAMQCGGGSVTCMFCGGAVGSWSEEERDDAQHDALMLRSMFASVDGAVIHVACVEGFAQALREKVRLVKRLGPLGPFAQHPRERGNQN